MSVTFFLAKHQDVALFESTNYNPHEPEDPIYNPRYREEQIFPSLNISNMNASMFLPFIGFPENLYGGKVEYKDLDEFCRKINKLETDSNLTGQLKFARYLQQLDKIVRYGIALKDDVVWC